MRIYDCFMYFDEEVVLDLRLNTLNDFVDYFVIVEKLAIQIHKNYKPTVLIGIMRGAAPIIDILSRIFKLPTAYVVIQSYSGDTVQDKQGELIFARDISAIATNEDFKKVLLVDDLSDTGLTLNKSIEWLKEYEPVKDHISEIKTACLWKKKSSTFTPDFCPILLDNDPWICLLYTSPSPRDLSTSRMPSSA